MVKYWDLIWDLWEWWCVLKSQHVQLTILILFLSLHPACRVCSPICLNGVFLKILHASSVNEFSCEKKLAWCVRAIYQVGIAFLLIFTNAACFFKSVFFVIHVRYESVSVQLYLQLLWMQAKWDTTTINRTD